MKKNLACILAMVLCNQPISGLENPFAFFYDKQVDLDADDYLKIQQSYDTSYLKEYLKDFYEHAKKEDEHFNISFTTFFNRTTRSLRNVMIDRSKNLEPCKEVIKLNQGGNICYVSSVPYRENYPEMMEKQINAFKNLGVNGYYLAFKGLFPTPTGEEVNLSAVPYAFKFFCIREAIKMGFEQVVWIDAAYIPVKDPSILLRALPQIGAIFTALPPNGFGRCHCPNRTSEVIKELTGTDIRKSTYVVAAIMGFLAKDPLVEELIEEFYQMARLGYPFLSGTPEENVLTGIIGQKKFKKWHKYNFSKKSPLWLDHKIRTYSEKEAIQKNGFFYYHLHPVAT
jgi:hypothetical protein